jgi:adenylate cyclase
LKIWGNLGYHDYLILSQSNSLFLTHLQATITGTVIGLVLSFVDNKRSTLYHKLGFGKIVLIKSISYFATIVIMVLLFIFIFTLVLAPSIAETLHRLSSFLDDLFFYNMIIYCAGVSFLVSFIKQLDNKFGPGNLLKMITGKYHHPVTEERIFLFLDLKDSTSIAERLGHIKYSELLQDCFSDISKMVKPFGAEIYQYVGDEVVLSWSESIGFSNNNCIRLFFCFQDIIKEKSDYYEKNYYCIPEFKGGMHYGVVTAVEIGDIKKEIVYHGDVLNTSSRIQNLCKKYGKDLLVSGNMVHRISGAGKYNMEFVDTVIPKGKSVEVDIFSIDCNGLKAANALMDSPVKNNNILSPILT